MANCVDNVIEIDGRMVLNDTLGEYARLTPSSVYDVSDLYVTLGSWSDTLGLIEDESLHDTVDDGYAQEDVKDTDDPLERLKAFGEEELRSLSARLIEDGYEIPDKYKMEIMRVNKEDEVYVEGAEDGDEYVAKLKIGQGRMKLRGTEEVLKTRLRDIINGLKLFSCSGIRPKE